MTQDVPTNTTHESRRVHATATVEFCAAVAHRPLDLIGADEKADKEESARRLVEMKKTVERVELTIGKAGSDKLTRVEEPIQR